MIRVDDVNKSDVLLMFNQVINTSMIIENWNNIPPERRTNIYRAKDGRLKLSGTTMLMDYLKSIYTLRPVHESWLSDVMQSITSDDLDMLDGFLERLLSRKSKTDHVYVQDEEINPNAHLQRGIPKPRKSKYE